MNQKFDHKYDLELLRDPGAKYKWRKSWIESPFRIDLHSDSVPKTVIMDRCSALGIHPMFWQYTDFIETVMTEYKMAGHFVPTSRIVERIVFYFAEDYCMYKLKYE